jgi:RNA polymerase sigma factor (sigma-70 family)
MPRLEPTLLAAQIRRMAAPESDALTDGELVGRYAGHRDAAAFEVLVWRHGPMVWATCRRILRHRHDVEDAFQATFLALARSAGTLGSRQAVGGWLHRVAVNAALKLKANRTSTALTEDVPARPERDDSEFAGAVDEEVERLPDRMRAAFVLCCLEGMTSAEAARELGCPVGTVDSRLHAARARLRDRLARRGFGPGALAGLVIVAAPPAAVVAAAVGVGTGVPPAPAVTALATHASRIVTHGTITMKTGISAVLALALAGTVWAFNSGGAPSVVPKPDPGSAPARGVNARPPAPVTVWGEPVDGLQAGLRCPRRVLGPGESVEVELVVRNVSRGPIAFEYLAWKNQTGGSVFLSGVPERGELRLGWSVSIHGIAGKGSALLGAGEEMVRGQVTLVHGKVGPVPAGTRPPIGLSAGAYRVTVDPVGEPTFDRLGGPGGVAFPRLGTGVLELTLPDATVRAAPVPNDRGEGRIVLWRDGHPVAIDPGTKGTAALLKGYEGKRGGLWPGPDGKRLLIYIANRMTLRPSDSAMHDRLYVWDGKTTAEIKIDVFQCHAFWGADGKVYGHGLAPARWADRELPPDLTKEFANWSFDPQTGKVKYLKLAGNELTGNVSILDISPDGKAFLVRQYEKPPGVPGVVADYRFGVLPAAGGDLLPLTKLGEATAGGFRYSPDGRFALGTMYRKAGGMLVPELVVFDLKSRTRSAVAVPKDAWVSASCWSPDGKRIAFVWEPKAAYEKSKSFGPTMPGQEKPTSTVTVARPDGSDAKDVYTETEYACGSIDWRGAAAPSPAP